MDAMGYSWYTKINKSFSTASVTNTSDGKLTITMTTNDGTSSKPIEGDLVSAKSISDADGNALKTYYYNKGNLTFSYANGVLTITNTI